jgi:ketosteroid isomerase-like protein
MKTILRSTSIFVLLAVPVAILSACASPEEIAAADKRTCAGYGFAEGTDAFANCMMQADFRRKKQADDWQRQQQQQQQQRRLAEDQQRQTEKIRPTHEHCISAGNSVTTGNAAAGGSTTSSFSNTVCSGS